MKKFDSKLLTVAVLSILFTNANAETAPSTTVITTKTTTVPAAATAPAAVPMPTPVDNNAPPTSAAQAEPPLPAAAPEPMAIKPSSNHGYVLAQGTINQPYGANPYRTLTVTVSPCDSGYSPYVSMSIGGIAGWASHTVAESWAVPTSMIKRIADSYVVNYRAETRFYNGSWAWSSNVYVTWTMYCIPTDSFTYTPH
jgi:hypothetical protein